MSSTDECPTCGGDCPMSSCRDCHGCESTPCPTCQEPEEGDDGDYPLRYEYEPCEHDCDEECYDWDDQWVCSHQHCFACGGCNCPGYCDDYKTYNLRPSETGGVPDADSTVHGSAAG